jgi:hypothetical protein
MSNPEARRAARVADRVSKKRLKRLLHVSRGKSRECPAEPGSGDKKSDERKAEPVGPKVALYRHFNARGRLLYVGISANPINRLLDHMYGSAWVSEIARIEIAWCVDRFDAVKQEARAVKDERPLWNQVHAPARVVREVRGAKTEYAECKASVTANGKRGPAAAYASPAEKQRAYRERKKAGLSGVDDR